MSELRDIRKRLGLTQTEMGARLGMALRGYQETEARPEPRRVVLLAARYVAWLDGKL